MAVIKLLRSLAWPAWTRGPRISITLRKWSACTACRAKFLASDLSLYMGLGCSNESQTPRRFRGAQIRKGGYLGLPGV
eukprot:scaffold167824_cov53-Prasinocladus_malaysianus.AAC.1